MRIYIRDMLSTEEVMRARKIVRWGNSMAVRLPKVVLRAAGLQEGDILEFGTKNGVIVAKPVTKKPALKDLLARVTPDNVHEEIDWGKPRGRESW
jgi:antitoxin MazE